MSTDERKLLTIEQVDQREEGPNSICMDVSEMHKWADLITAYADDFDQRGALRTKSRRMIFRRSNCVKVLVLSSAWWRFWSERRIQIGFHTYDVDEYDNPPHVAEKIRALTCRPNLRHSHLGCMAEIYSQDVERFGRSFAIYLYCWDTARDLAYAIFKAVPVAVAGYVVRTFLKWWGS